MKNKEKITFRLFISDNNDLENMKSKFDTTLNDFIKNRFRDPLDIDYKDIKLYFVSKQEIYKRDLGLKMEVLMNIIFYFS